MKAAYFSNWVVFIAALAAAPVHAAGIAIEPAFQDVSVGADQSSVDTSVRLINNDAVTHVLRLSAIDFGQLGESGGIAFLGQPGDVVERPYGLAAWLIIERDQVVIEPGQAVEVKATVINRQSLSPGGHYAAIIASLIDEESVDGGTQVSLHGALSSLLFITKTGGEVYQLQLGSVHHPPTWWRLPQIVDLRFTNSGNVHVIPRGRVTIQDFRGNLVAEGTINPGSLPILPERIRQVPVDMRLIHFPVLPGIYQMKIQSRYDGRDDFTTTQESLLYIGPYSLASALLLFVAGHWLAKRRLGWG